MLDFYALWSWRIWSCLNLWVNGFEWIWAVSRNIRWYTVWKSLLRWIKRSFKRQRREAAGAGWWCWWKAVSWELPAGWWQLKYLKIFTPKINFRGRFSPILTRMFFRWIGSTTNQPETNSLAGASSLVSFREGRFLSRELGEMSALCNFWYRRTSPKKQVHEYVLVWCDVCMNILTVSNDQCAGIQRCIFSTCRLRGLAVDTCRWYWINLQLHPFCACFEEWMVDVYKPWGGCRTLPMLVSRGCSLLDDVLVFPLSRSIWINDAALKTRNVQIYGSISDDPMMTPWWSYVGGAGPI